MAYDFPAPQVSAPYPDTTNFSVYTTLGWSADVWINTGLNLKPKLTNQVIKEGFPKPIVIEGNTITLAQAKQRASYQNWNGWEFGSTWAIRENQEFPRLLRAGSQPVFGDPLTSNKWVVYVKPSDNGSMFFQNEMYESERKSVKISMFEGEEGEQVTHVYEGRTLPDLRGTIYTFLASGVENHDYPGGYGVYTSATSRTVTLRADRSANVTFYYALAELPDYNFLMRVSLPDELVHIAIMKEDVSDVKVKMHDGSVCTVALVPLDWEEASPIRVATPDGVFALKNAFARISDPEVPVDPDEPGTGGLPSGFARMSNYAGDTVASQAEVDAFLDKYKAYKSLAVFRGGGMVMVAASQSAYLNIGADGELQASDLVTLLYPQQPAYEGTAEPGPGFAPAGMVTRVEYFTQ